MSDRIKKFESPVRLAELDSKKTLVKAGFKEDMVLCDIGAGSGIFSFPAAEISNREIYALEISDEMIKVLESRALENHIQNLIIKKVDSNRLPLQSGLCDMAIMVTVLHEIDQKEFMMQEIKRILKEEGKLAIIEFHKGGSPMGPPADHRISEEDVIGLCAGQGFQLFEKWILGDNFYCIVFEAVS